MFFPCPVGPHWEFKAFPVTGLQGSLLFANAFMFILPMVVDVVPWLQ
jgi:hypothetical protein